jgi:N,N'-diacetyllegionaminate synthase
VRIGPLDLHGSPMLIAEIGNNHEGDPAAALILAEQALDCGAHAVKYQMIDPRRLVTADQVDRVRQLERFQLPLDVYEDIARRVHQRGAIFMASAFDLDSLAAILPFLDAVKIASGDLDFDPLLIAAARSGKPVVLSTGMATLQEIDHAVDTFREAMPRGATLEERLALLHCVSLYPSLPEHANLSAMHTLRERFGLTTGYSDHVLGIEVAAMALGMGASIIEKHFTLDKNSSLFRDHALSADPAELARLGALLRRADAIRGNGTKDDSVADRDSARVVRRSLVAARELAAGTVLTSADLEFLRPGDGVSPTQAGKVIGRRLLRPLRRHEAIRLEELD